MTVCMDEIRPNPLNPRAKYDRSQIEDMAKSISERGLIYPIIARKVAGGYEIVSGHLRFIALKSLGKTELVEGKDIEIREMDDRSAIRLMVDDNIKRWNYNPAEAAKAIALLREYIGLTTAQIADQYGVDRAVIGRILKVATLPDRVAKKVVWGHGFVAMGQKKRKGAITVLHAERIAELDTNESKARLARVVEKYCLTASETGKIAKLMKKEPWTPVEELVSAVKSAFSRNYTVTIDSRDVDDALREASKAENETPEKTIAGIVREWLTERGYLSAKAREREEIREWLEEELGSKEGDAVLGKAGAGI